MSPTSSSARQLITPLGRLQTWLRLSLHNPARLQRWFFQARDITRSPSAHAADLRQLDRWRKLGLDVNTCVRAIPEGYSGEELSPMPLVHAALESL